MHVCIGACTNRITACEPAARRRCTGATSAGHCCNIQTVFDNQGKEGKGEAEGTKWKVFSRRLGQLERSPDRCRHDNTLKSRGLWEIKASAAPRYSAQLRSVCCCLLVFLPPSLFIPPTFCLMYSLTTFLLLFCSDMCRLLFTLSFFPGVVLSIPSFTPSLSFTLTSFCQFKLSISCFLFSSPPARCLISLLPFFFLHSSFFCFPYLFIFLNYRSAFSSPSHQISGLAPLAAL